MSDEQKNEPDMGSDTNSLTIKKEKVVTLNTTKLTLLIFLAFFVLGYFMYVLYSMNLLNKETTVDLREVHNVNTYDHNTQSGLVIDDDTSQKEFASLRNYLLAQVDTDVTNEIVEEIFISTGETKVIELDVHFDKNKMKHWIIQVEGLRGSRFQIQIYGPDDTLIKSFTTDANNNRVNFETRKLGTWRVIIKAGKTPQENYPIVFVASSKEVDDVINIQTSGLEFLFYGGKPDLSSMEKETGVLSVTLYSDLSKYFNVNDIDLTSLEFTQAPFWRKSGETNYTNSPTEPTVTVDFLISDIKVDEEEGEYYLKGETFDGVPIRWSSIRG